MQFNIIGIFGLILLFLSHITSNNLIGSSLQNSSRITTQSASAVFVESDDKSISHYIIKPQFLLHIDSDEHISLFRYNIGINFESILAYPHKMTKIVFINEELVFEDSAILPEPLIFTFDVYTCKHNSPVLIKIYSQSGYNFYFPNPESGKWTNYSIDELRAFERINGNGIKFYRLNRNQEGDDLYENYDLMHESMRGEATKLAERLCKKDKCVDNSSSTDYNLEISVTVIENKREAANNS